MLLKNLMATLLVSSMHHRKLNDEAQALQHRLRAEAFGLKRAARIAQRTDLMNEILGRVPGAGHENH